MASIRNDIPDQLQAGDRWQWRKTLADYPAGTWTLTYYFSAPQLSANKARFGGAIGARGTANLSITATADGDAFLVDATPVDVTPGNYSYQAKVTDGTHTHTVDTGFVEVLEDLSQRDNDYDERTQAQFIVEKCDAAIAALLEGKPVESYQIGQRNLKRMPLAELRETRAMYAGLARSGGPLIGSIRARFV